METLANARQKLALAYKTNNQADILDAAKKIKEIENTANLAYRNPKEILDNSTVDTVNELSSFNARKISGTSTPANKNQKKFSLKQPVFVKEKYMKDVTDKQDGASENVVCFKNIKIEKTRLETIIEKLNDEELAADQLTKPELLKSFCELENEPAEENVLKKYFNKILDIVKLPLGQIAEEKQTEQTDEKNRTNPFANHDDKDNKNGQLAQRDSESVFDYSERLGDLTDELKIAESRDKSGIAITEACLIETFVRGLKQDIITRMPKTTTLGDAFREAQRIEKILMAEKELRSKNSTAKGCVFCNTTSHETLACEVFLAIKRKNTPAPDTGEARVDNAYYTPRIKERCGHCGSEEHSLNNCKIFFSANIKSEKKEPEVISEKKEAHENDENTSELSKSCSTRSWQDGAATRLYEQNGSIDTHANDKKQSNTLEITENSKSTSSLVILAPQRIFCEENKDNSNVAEVNASIASPCICKGKKADDAIEDLRKDKEVAAIFEDNDFEMIESIKSEEKIEEIFNVIDPCDETYESYMIDTDDMNYCYERMLQINSKFENTSERVYEDCLSRNPIIESVNIVETRSRTIKTKPVNYKLTRTRNTKPKQLSEDKTSDVNDKEDKAVEIERGDAG
uniref:Uncharacterized protein n=1 Tax=Trichogramma kaykai TaxID=54128 RepID=A0ABD2WAF5_9HYME